jgi:hypothetical protein
MGVVKWGSSFGKLLRSEGRARNADERGGRKMLGGENADEGRARNEKCRCENRNANLISAHVSECITRFSG